MQGIRYPYEGRGFGLCVALCQVAKTMRVATGGCGASTLHVGNVIVLA